MKAMLFIAVSVSQLLFAFEPAALNLKVPSRLEKTEAVFLIQHRFYGNITDDPFGTFFGLNAGANIGIGLRYALLSKLEINTHYIRSQREFAFGASYAKAIEQLSLHSQLDIQFFSYALIGLEERRQNFYYGLALQTEPLIKIITPTINISYDGYNETFGIGCGLALSFSIDFGPFDRIAIIGEYFPIIQRADEIHGSENCYIFGLKSETYGHHFMLMTGNNSAISARRLMLGTGMSDLYAGFNIHRHFDL